MAYEKTGVEMRYHNGHEWTAWMPATVGAHNWRNTQFEVRATPDSKPCAHQWLLVTNKRDGYEAWCPNCQEIRSYDW